MQNACLKSRGTRNDFDSGRLIRVIDNSINTIRVITDRTGFCQCVVS